MTFSLEEREKCTAICQSFVQEAATCFPDLNKKSQGHLLHLVGNIVDFRPTFAFNTESYVQLKGVAYMLILTDVRLLTH